MIRTVCVVLSLAVAYVAGQYYNNDPRNAAILQESRYQNADGKFGATYTQEDGVQFKEETDADGTRRGSYSYVDPSGQRKTVSYTAGKAGFLAVGDHLPGGGVNQPPSPGYTPLPQYNSPPQQQPQYQPQQQQSQYRPPPPQPQPQYRPQPQPQPQPQYRPQPQQQYRPQPQPQYQSQPQPQPQYRPEPQQYRPQYSTTQAPHRFYPPGKLSLNRSPEGFSFTFNKA